MTGEPQRRRWTPPVATDLVEYIVVVVPDLDSLANVGQALVEMVDNSLIRVLDVVVISKDTGGEILVLELEAVEGLRVMRRLVGDTGGLLSDHDLELVALALSPGAVGIVVATEDSWAEPLSRAAHRAGGRILAGERIPTARVEAALANRPED